MHLSEDFVVLIEIFCHYVFNKDDMDEEEEECDTDRHDHQIIAAG